jgi:hypothetical protein
VGYLETENFPDDRIQRYAIPSHRCGEDEAKFQDSIGHYGANKKGYEKGVKYHAKSKDKVNSNLV